ncbi:hypothetical protein [uncultured Thiodictyon sp.]|nr:hypothetical protein [uncultured Thiodictyon sp.]
MNMNLGTLETLVVLTVWIAALFPLLALAAGLSDLLVEARP